MKWDQKGFKAHHNKNKKRKKKKKVKKQTTANKGECGPAAANIKRWRKPLLRRERPTSVSLFINYTQTSHIGPTFGSQKNKQKKMLFTMFPWKSSPHRHTDTHQLSSADQGCNATASAWPQQRVLQLRRSVLERRECQLGLFLFSVLLVNFTFFQTRL